MGTASNTKPLTIPVPSPARAKHTVAILKGTQARPRIHAYTAVDDVLLASTRRPSGGTPHSNKGSHHVRDR